MWGFNNIRFYDSLHNHRLQEDIFQYTKYIKTNERCAIRIDMKINSENTFVIFLGHSILFYSSLLSTYLLYFYITKFLLFIYYLLMIYVIIKGSRQL